MSKNVFIYGAGGHAKVVLDILNLNHFTTVAILDDDPQKEGQCLLGYPVYLASKSLSGFVKQGLTGIAAIGNNTHRARAAQRIMDCGGKLVTAIHPKSVIDETVSIGPGTVVMAGVIVNSSAVIGSNVILNTACTIDHDCIIADHSHISPGAHLGGNVQVGEFSHIGIGASILPNLTIADRVMIGGGAVVIDSIPSGVVAVGVPAKVCKSNNK